MKSTAKTTRLRFLALMGLAIGLTTGQTACAASKPASTAAVQSPGTMELADLQARFAQIADRVTPSIVAISAVPSESSTNQALLLGTSVDGPRLAAALDRVSRTVGTGFIIDAEGYIVTAEHVVSEAEQLWITTDDQKVYPAMVVGSDPRSDLAVLKIPARGLRPVTFGPAEGVKRGQWAFTMGNPYGLATGGELAMSVGVVAAVNRSLPRLSAAENRLYTNLIQTTAEINPGNSGGPLFDLEGRVIGVNAAVVLPQKNTNGIGFSFAITEDLITKVQHLKAGEAVQHAYLGVSVSTSNVNGTNGARVDTVLPDGPAGSSGLAIGDIVIDINGVAVSSSDTFAQTISSLTITKPATLKFIRDGSTKSVAITPRLRPVSRTAVYRANQRLYWGGIILGPVASGSGYEVKNIAASSPLAKRGIAKGAIVTGVHGAEAGTLSELLNQLGTVDAESCELDLAASNAAPVKTIAN